MSLILTQIALIVLTGAVLVHLFSHLWYDR